MWYVDNTAALHALVKGRSKHSDLDRMAEVIHLALYTWNIWCYYEWVESCSNWADGISRTFADDDFAARHHFSIRELPFDHSWLQLSYKELWVRSRCFDASLA